MRLTVNQSLNLLYIHFREPSHTLGLTEAEVTDLTLEVVSKYEELQDSPYKERMVPQSKSELVDTLRSAGAEGIFLAVH